MTEIAVGVIGTGGMGTRHAHNLHRYVAGARVAAVYDIDQARAVQVAAECGGARVFAEPTELIRSPGVQAVVIVSPDPTHAGFVLECLREQKPVLCEKPLATSADEAMAVIEAELSIGRRLVSVGYMRRFDPQHVAVKQSVAAQQIGRPILFKGVHRNPMILPYLAGSSVVTNSASHDIDSARWLLGQEVTQVFVQGVRTHESFSDETQDMVLIQMGFTGGCLATIECSVAVEYGYEVLAEIVGECGAALTLPIGEAVVRSGSARTQAISVPQSHLERFQQAFVPELCAWIASIQSGETFPGASAWDGYMATLVAEACVQSLSSGTPVKVENPQRPALY